MKRHMIRTALFSWYCLSSVLVVAAFQQPGAPADTVVAIVTAVTGDVTSAAPSETPRAIALFDRLREGEILATSADAEVTVAWRSGVRLRLRSSSGARVLADGLERRTGAIDALPAVPTLPLVATFVAAPGSTLTAVRIRARGVGSLYPDAGARALADDATLEFAAVDGTTSYEVELENERGDLVLRLRTRLPRVAIPAGVLRPSSRYFWRVRARTPDGASTTGEATFLTLSAAEQEQRARLHAALDGTPHARGLAAELDDRLGLWREALAGFVAARDAGARDAVITSRIDALNQRLAGPPGRDPR